MQGCKAYRLCSVAVLNELGKEWWIDMKNVQISEELFVAIMRYFILEQEELLPQIKQGLEKKLDAMVMRELYTKYKTAPTEEEKEKALTLLMNHYHPVSVKFNPKFVHMTQCMKIIVNDMTAKRAMQKKNALDYKVP